jgi:hypothetical protein
VRAWLARRDGAVTLVTHRLAVQANLHTWKVVIRFCRYRDLAKSVWGAYGKHLEACAHVLFWCIMHPIDAARSVSDEHLRPS